MSVFEQGHRWPPALTRHGPPAYKDNRGPVACDLVVKRSASGSQEHNASCREALGILAAGSAYRGCIADKGDPPGDLREVRPNKGWPRRAPVHATRVDSAL